MSQRFSLNTVKKEKKERTQKADQHDYAFFHKDLSPNFEW